MRGECQVTSTASPLLILLAVRVPRTRTLASGRGPLARYDWVLSLALPHMATIAYRHVPIRNSEVPKSLFVYMNDYSEYAANGRDRATPTRTHPASTIGLKSTKMPRVAQGPRPAGSRAASASVTATPYKQSPIKYVSRRLTPPQQRGREAPRR